MQEQRIIICTTHDIFPHYSIHVILQKPQIYSLYIMSSCCEWSNRFIPPLYIESRSNLLPRLFKLTKPHGMRTTHACTCHAHIIIHNQIWPEYHNNDLPFHSKPGFTLHYYGESYQFNINTEMAHVPPYSMHNTPLGKYMRQFIFIHTHRLADLSNGRSSHWKGQL